MATEDEIRAAAVRETAAYLERVTRKGLVPLSVVLADLEAVAERMSQGMTARGSLRSPVSANREDSEPAPDAVRMAEAVVGAPSTGRHRMGDRVVHYRDPHLTGEIADIVRPENHPMYGVRWDSDPGRVARWYPAFELEAEK